MQTANIDASMFKLPCSTANEINTAETILAIDEDVGIDCLNAGVQLLQIPHLTQDTLIFLTPLILTLNNDELLPPLLMPPLLQLVLPLLQQC